MLRYRFGTPEYALKISASVDVLVSYGYVDWAGDRVDRKSKTGVFMQLGIATVVWRSIKQARVVLITTEAEYCSISDGAKLIVWLRKIL